MSDFGVEDHYVAAVKAKIISINPGLKIVDISHHIEPFNIAHASYVLSSVFRDFPEGTIHIAAVNSDVGQNAKYIVAQVEGHFFVGPDNGLFSLVSEEEPSLIAEISSQDGASRTFPAKNVYAKAAAMLASGSNINDIGAYTKDFKRLISRKFRATKKQISGNVIRVDRYGNLVTNIEKQVFDIIHQDRPFMVSFGRERIVKIHNAPDDVEDGDCFVAFNDAELLEIGINKGNASQLLGLHFDSSVHIIFDAD
jgi:S-adenosylmethionine hydrolase